MSLLREWTVTEAYVVEDCYKYILEYVAARPNLANFVKRELLVCCAKIYKRGIFDHKVGDIDSLCVTVEQLLSSHQEYLQGLGCELIETTAAEFFSSWRSSGFGITWDFHLRAKRAFETSGLKRLFELSLRMLQHVANADLTASCYHMSLCDKFLRVAEIVLSWNFASRFLPPRLTFCVEMSSGGALRPPITWKEIFQNDDLLNLFFQLHRRVRSDETLCERSMNCLVQLSSLMGDVLNASENDTHDPYDHYMFLYIRNLLELFQSGPLPNEVTGFCTIWYKLFNFHKLQTFIRFDDAFLSTMLNYMTQYAEHLAPIAMHNSLVDDDDSYRGALTNLYEAWLVMVRGFERTQRKGFLKDYTVRILSSFMRTLLSEPAGQRTDISSTECMQDFELDDRDHFADTLKLIGHFAGHCLDVFLPMLYSILKSKLEQFYTFISNGVDEKTMDAWREDMHWILILFGYILTEADDDGSCHLPAEVCDFCIAAPKSVNAGSPFIRACIENPRSIPDDLYVDPILKVTGVILAWCSLEHSLLVEGGANMVSPELMRTSFWITRRLFSALSVPPDNSNEQNSLIPMLDINNEFSTFLVQFVFHKTFTVLGKLSGEKKLCKDASDLLLALVDSRAAEMAANDLLYISLSHIQLDKLPVRRSLIHTLVLIGAAADDEQIRQRMYLSILEPLSNKFEELCSNPMNNESNLADLLDCFCGVALASQRHSAAVLFRFIAPLLGRCVKMFSAKNISLVLTNAILDLFAVATRKLMLYIDQVEESQFCYEILLELIQAYRREQLEKYREVDIDQEDKATDLLLLLDVLANIMSKDALYPVDPTEVHRANGARTAFLGLEMLLPLMDEHLLKFPSIASKFYNLLLYFAEMAPEYFNVISEEMFLSIMECLRHGLQCLHGQEVFMRFYFCRLTSSHYSFFPAIQVAMISVETLNELAKYHSQDPHPRPIIIMQLSSLIEDMFVMCLEFSCQVDMLNEATFALYALICCNRAAFEAMAMNLLAKEQNAVARN
ncbi:unnamed protein product, partial [Anisakis simplex]